jgi:hypothetical protein
MKRFFLPWMSICIRLVLLHSPETVGEIISSHINYNLFRDHSIKTLYNKWLESGVFVESLLFNSIVLLSIKFVKYNCFFLYWISIINRVRRGEGVVIWGRNKKKWHLKKTTKENNNSTGNKKANTIIILKKDGIGKTSLSVRSSTRKKKKKNMH